MPRRKQEQRRIMGNLCMKNDGTFGAIDDLTITYDGNHLLKVTDNAETLNYNGALDFDDGDDSTCEYHYDSNGALTYDSNRGITKITYDYSHYPSAISRASTDHGVGSSDHFSWLIF